MMADHALVVTVGFLAALGVLFAGNVSTPSAFRPPQKSSLDTMGINLMRTRASRCSRCRCPSFIETER
jgi:hypothetical protein